MNKVLLAGNLTRDPVVRKTSAGLAVADLGLAVNESYRGSNGKSEESTCFVDVIAWDKQAEHCGEYLHKGSSVLVEGRLQLDQWKDKDGQNRSKIKVNAQRVQFMGKPAEKGGARPARGSRDGDDD
ncbi:MAG TPA: single-stranded DNA-binding protein [Kiritimatiellia bacterium]|nr:single-stranded DNA-binding protein [Kiritimatiellia bacterium]